MSKRDTRTRRAVLDLLKREGPSEAPDLATWLEVTDMAVRQHLYTLEEEGYVETISVPRPRGRPAKKWALTQKANRYFPDAHAELTADLLTAMQTALGDAGMEALLAERSRMQKEAYAKELKSRKSLRGKLDALAALRTDEGYVAAVEKQGDDYLLVENHCPICVAAKACSGLCAAELAVFKHALGPEVNVERTDHILAGARRCAYRIQVKGTKAVKRKQAEEQAA